MKKKNIKRAKLTFIQYVTKLVFAIATELTLELAAVSEVFSRIYETTFLNGTAGKHLLMLMLAM